MILQEDMAIDLFTTLKAANKPAFFGKDVVHENLFGISTMDCFQVQL